MKVPFFRSKTAKAAGSSETKGQRRSGLGMLEGITSESELSSYSNTPAPTPLSPRTTNASVAALPKLRTAPANSAHKGGSTAAGAIAGQLAEMEGFLDTITGFQNEARRLFPENMALDQILTDLQDECQRRVMYMTRVSAPPAWMASHQRQSSSSSTIGATAGITAPGNLSSGGRHSTVALGQQSPVSTTTMTSNNSSSSSTDSGSRSRGDSAATSSDGGDGDKNNKGSSRNYFSRHSHNHNHSNSSTKKAPAGGGGSPPTPRIPSSFNTVPLSASSRAGNSPLKRDPRTADSRRKAAAQSMFVSSPSGDPGPAKNNSGNSRHATSSMGVSSAARFTRNSSMNLIPEPPRRPRSRTSSAEQIHPQSMADAAAVSGDSVGARRSIAPAPSALNTKTSFNVVRSATGGIAPATAEPKQQQQQHAPAAAGKMSGDYVMVLKLAGLKFEATVSSSLQASLISLPLATQMGMLIQRVPPHSRVWDRRGSNWPVVGKVVGLPFVCGNMSFTHDFQVVQGSAGGLSGGIDMPRDLMLGNDFCVGNKGHIKDNRLYLEQLCTSVSVPVRQITAN